MFRTLVAAALAVLTVACDESSGEPPEMQILGGGFVFNYNIAEAYYGVVVKAVRGVSPGMIVEAQFENPSGGERFILRQTAVAGRREYSFQSPPVHGVKADRGYMVEVRLLDPTGAEVLTRTEKAFRSSTDQDMLPSRPLTVGPGYQPSPDLDKLLNKSSD